MSVTDDQHARHGLAFLFLMPPDDNLAVVRSLAIPAVFVNAPDFADRFGQQCLLLIRRREVVLDAGPRATFVSVTAEPQRGTAERTFLNTHGPAVGHQPIATNREECLFRRSQGVGKLLGSTETPLMSQSPQQLLAEALEMPLADRGQLAAALIESLDECTDDDIEQAWADEIQQRLRDIDEGTVQMIPWSEVRRRLRGRDGSAS